MSIAVIPQNQIPPREAGTNKCFIDLTSWYNHALTDDIHHKQGNTLSDLGTGLKEIDGCFFDIRGMIQLAGKDSEIITTLCYPNETGPIELGFKLKPFISFMPLHGILVQKKFKSENTGLITTTIQALLFHYFTVIIYMTGGAWSTN